MGMLTYLTLIICSIFFVSLLMAYKRGVLNSPLVEIRLNDDRIINAKKGEKLLTILKREGVVIPSSCNGKGLCGQCRCQVDGDKRLTSPEKNWFSDREKEEGTRLSCQVKVRTSFQVTLSRQITEAGVFSCTVLSNNNLSTFIKELTLKLSLECVLNYVPGDYVMISVPPHELKYGDITVDEEFRRSWSQNKMRLYNSRVPYPVECAYSIASIPDGSGVIKLNIRVLQSTFLEINEKTETNRFISQPSAYLFNKTAGEQVTISGSFGNFQIDEGKDDSEIIFIGGGTGIAPLYSHICHLFSTLKTQKKVSFWYGCRCGVDQIYQKEFDQLVRENNNFRYHVAFSEPLPEELGVEKQFIHDLLFKSYLKKHPNPRLIHYYLCGPTKMIVAAYNMLLELDVDDVMIHIDEQLLPRHMLKSGQIDAISGATTII